MSLLKLSGGYIVYGIIISSIPFLFIPVITHDNYAFELSDFNSTDARLVFGM